MSVRPCGDRAFLIELEQRRDPALVARSRAIADAWEAGGLGPAVPAYASVLLRFDPARTSYAAALRVAETVERETAATQGPQTGPITVVPVRYDGPDLAETAARSGVAVDALVALHAATTYTAWFVGFMPGFAYLGPLDPRIVAPRRPSPRARVPAGSVAVADGQTAIYPADSPGGWQLIGSTDLRVFDPARDPAARIRAGDRVRFVPS
ncbi:MAG TPA: allophanate hydrolase subunit 1 [Candidatus Limnocylindria bacterium]